MFNFGQKPDSSCCVGCSCSWYWFHCLFPLVTARERRLQFSQAGIAGLPAGKNTITQQAMGNAIDFTVSGQIHHRYTVTNSTEDNTTLHHDVKRIGFMWKAWAQRGFDSDNPKDLEGMFGPRVKELMGKPMI